MKDPEAFGLSEEEWREFLSKLNRPAVAIPKLQELLKEQGMPTLDPQLGYTPAIPEPLFTQGWLSLFKRYTCTACHQKFHSRSEYEYHYITRHIL